jgi:hypothetical protein
MSTTKAHKSQRSIRVRERSFHRIKKLATTYRDMPVVEVLDLLLDGWDRLTTKQQAEIVASPKKAGT